jgi:Amidohydrolase family
MTLLSSSFVSLVIGLVGGQKPPDSAKDLVIVDTRIEVGNGTVIPKGSIWIHEGKVAGVAESLSIPPKAEVIQGTGLTAYPGFIDAYTTNGLKLPDAPTSGTAPESRSTAPTSMWHGNRKGIRSDILASKCLELKDQLSDAYSQGIITAVISPGTGTVRGTATLVDYLGKGQVLVPELGEELSFRSGSGTGTSQGYPSTLFATVALLRQTLADAQYFAAQSSPPKDVALSNLVPLVTKKSPALFIANTQRELVRASRIADEFDLKWWVVGGTEAYRDIPLLKSKGLSVLVNMDPGLEPSIKPETTPGAAPKAILVEKHDLWVERGFNVKKLDEAGVPYALSTHGTGSSDFLKNVRKVVSSGVSRQHVLQAITSGSAQILGVSDQVGTIEVGKLGNVVLMSGPFEEEKSKVMSVVVEGNRIEVTKGTPKSGGAK